MRGVIGVVVHGGSCRTPLSETKPAPHGGSPPVHLAGLRRTARVRALGPRLLDHDLSGAEVLSTAVGFAGRNVSHTAQNAASCPGHNRLAGLDGADRPARHHRQSGERSPAKDRAGRIRETGGGVFARRRARRPERPDSRGPRRHIPPRHRIRHQAGCRGTLRRSRAATARVGTVSPAGRLRRKGKSLQVGMGDGPRRCRAARRLAMKCRSRVEDDAVVVFSRAAASSARRLGRVIRGSST